VGRTADGGDAGNAEGDRGERWRRGGMRRGIGCLIVLMGTVVVSIGVVVLWLLAGLLGLGNATGFLADLARPAAAVVLIVGAMAVMGAIRFASGVGGPLSDLVDAAGRIEAADYSVRVREGDGRRELRRLSHAFNAMAARLESEDATRRRLLADIGHELRTPLAVIQGNLEALVDGVYPPDEAHIGPIIEEAKVLERLIDDLRTLGLAESGALPLHREPTDIRALVEDVAAAQQARPDVEGRRIETAIVGELPTLDVDPVRLRQVLTNLVDNAVRHGRPDGRILLGAGLEAAPVEAPATGGAPSRPTVVLMVEDDGPGIPAELRATLFDRFTRSAGSTGSGLGLAIAKAVVEAHGGEIEARATPTGVGTAIWIRLPAP
jgi:two-component system, OmpR family, sensor histidine kinase BaeS